VVPGLTSAKPATNSSCTGAAACMCIAEKEQRQGQCCPAALQFKNNGCSSYAACRASHSAQKTKPPPDHCFFRGQPSSWLQTEAICPLGYSKRCCVHLFNSCFVQEVSHGTDSCCVRQLLLLFVATGNSLSLACCLCLCWSVLQWSGWRCACTPLQRTAGFVRV
jgi:hypothetical protein